MSQYNYSLECKLNVSLVHLRPFQNVDKLKDHIYQNSWLYYLYEVTIDPPNHLEIDVTSETGYPNIALKFISRSLLERYECPNDFVPSEVYDEKSNGTYNLTQGIICVGIRNNGNSNYFFTKIAVKPISFNPENTITLSRFEIVGIISGCILFGMVVGIFIGCIPRKEKKEEITTPNEYRPINQ